MVYLDQAAFQRPATSAPPSQEERIPARSDACEARVPRTKSPDNGGGDQKAQPPPAHWFP
jgi:hypothetical protein